MTQLPTALWVTPVSNLAGVARHIIDVARVGLPGWQMVVTAPEGPLLDALRELDTPVIPLAIHPIKIAPSISALRKTVHTVQPLIVHSHLAKADLLTTMAAAPTPSRLVTTEHHISPDRFMFHPNLLGAIGMEKLHHSRLKHFAAAIAVSESTKRDMEQRWKPKLPIRVILNGVDRPDTPPDRQPGLRFLSLTRLSPEKNVQATLRAFSLVSKQYPHARLTVAGTGEESDQLQELAWKLGIQDRTSFPGFVASEQAMANHDVIVQPSKSDNCSYTLLDAVAQGMGVAASPIGGNPEILPARCIADFDDDPGLARIMIEQALNPNQHPSLPDVVPTVQGMATQITEVYRDALNDQR